VLIICGICLKTLERLSPLVPYARRGIKIFYLFFIIYQDTYGLIVMYIYARACKGRMATESGRSWDVSHVLRIIS